MPQLGPEEEFERFRNTGAGQESLADEDAVVRYHLEKTGRTILYGPVDKEVPESLALVRLAIMQVVDFSLEEELATDKLRPTINGRIFIPDTVVVLNDKGLYSDMMAKGALAIQLSGDSIERQVEVEQSIFFAGKAARLRKHFFNREPTARIRTRIFEV